MTARRILDAIADVAILAALVVAGIGQFMPWVRVYPDRARSVAPAVKAALPGEAGAEPDLPTAEELVELQVAVDCDRAPAEAVEADDPLLDDRREEDAHAGGKRPALDIRFGLRSRCGGARRLVSGSRRERRQSTENPGSGPTSGWPQKRSETAFRGQPSRRNPQSKDVPPNANEPRSTPNDSVRTRTNSARYRPDPARTCATPAHTRMDSTRLLPDPVRRRR